MESFIDICDLVQWHKWRRECDFANNKSELSGVGFLFNMVLCIFFSDGRFVYLVYMSVALFNSCQT